MAEEKVKGQLTPEEKTAFRETILNFIPLLKQLHSQFDQWGLLILSMIEYFYLDIF